MSLGVAKCAGGQQPSVSAAGPSACAGEAGGWPPSSHCCQLPQRHNSYSGLGSAGHTIHPKLSLSAKRSVAGIPAAEKGGGEGRAQSLRVQGRGPMTAGGRQQPQNAENNAQQQQAGGTNQAFQLTISICSAETNVPIAFKQDGNRFQTSQRTLKLHCNSKYKVTVSSKPAQDFLSLHMGGSDLELVTEGQKPNSGEYAALWNTTGIDPSRKGVRQDILFVLAGPGKTLSRKLQTKFYARQNSHAGMGHRLVALVWRCELDPAGQVQVADERLL